MVLPFYTIIWTLLGFYNRIGIHSTLGYISSEQFEKKSRVVKLCLNFIGEGLKLRFFKKFEEIILGKDSKVRRIFKEVLEIGSNGFPIGFLNGAY